MHDVVIRDMPSLRLIGFDHRGPYPEIKSTFDRLVAWAEARGALGPQTRFFGLYYDNPRAVAPDDLRAFAGLIDLSAAPDGGARSVEVPGGRCAVFVHKGPYAGLEDSYLWFYDSWIPANGETPDPDRPCCEEYLNDPGSLPPEEWLTQIAAPLK